MKTIDLLRLQFPGRALIRAVEAGAAIGYSVSYTRQMLHYKRFPMPTVQAGDMRMVKLQDLAEYIDKLPSTGKRRRGRPPKAKHPADRATDAQGDS